MQRRVAQVPIEVNPSKLGGVIPDEATRDGSNLAAEAAKRNQTQGELICGLILDLQLAYSSPHQKMKSEAYRDLFVTNATGTGIRLSLSKMEHTKTATCHSLRQVNIGQLLIE